MSKNKKYLTDYLPSPSEANQEADIMNSEAVADGMDNGLAMGIEILGSLASKYGGALGGGAATAKYGKKEDADPNLEVEKNEVVDDPEKGVYKMKGKTHKQGGEDINISQGTNVFSDKIKDEKGDSLAQRKEYREKRKKKLQKMIEDDKLDKAKRNTYEKEMQKLQAEEKRDLRNQQRAGLFAKLLGLDQDEGEEEAKYGKEDLPKAPTGLNGFLGETLNIINERQESIDAFSSLNNSSDFNIGDSIGDDETTSSDEYTGYEIGDELSTNSGENSDFNLSEILGGDGGMKAGDIAKLAGNIQGAVSMMSNVENARAADKPHENYYDEVGDEAIDELENSDDDLDTAEANQKKRLRVRTSANKREGRRKARGINQMRATDTVANLQETMADNDIFNKMLSQRMKLDTQKASIKNKASVYEAQGEEKARIRRDKDVDAYFSNKGAALQNISTALQQTGKDLNTSAMNPVKLELINSLSQFYEVNGKGEIVPKKQE